MSERCFAVVTGGGTAGHVLPAIAVGEALVAAGHSPAEIHYVGAARGVETSLVPATPFAHTFYDVVGFQRSLSRRNLGFVPSMLRARRQAIADLRRLAPRVVVSVGGYASMPAVFAARRLRIPIVVVSYDRLPGRASALTARWAASCAVAFADSPLPRAHLTGAPLRQAVLVVDRSDAESRSAARASLDVPEDRFLVAVMGGSQGSGLLNGAVRTMLARWADDRSIAIRHAAGTRFVDSCDAPREGSQGVYYQPLGYEHRMPDVYAAADVLIGRGGASTVHEVAATGIPAILVPWAGSAEDHQTANVRWLSDAGAAELLPETVLSESPQALAALVESLRQDPARCASLSSAARRLGEVHRAGTLASLIESVAAPA